MNPSWLISDAELLLLLPLGLEEMEERDWLELKEVVRLLFVGALEECFTSTGLLMAELCEGRLGEEFGLGSSTAIGGEIVVEEEVEEEVEVEEGVTGVELGGERRGCCCCLE
jgi:hypothetical protein